MSAFTDAERAYLQNDHPMARLATVGADGTPHVMPIGMYRLDGNTDAIDTHGRDLAGTKKWRDVIRSGRAAIVIDDVLPPFSPRGIEVRGRAEVIEGAQPSIRIHPNASSHGDWMTRAGCATPGMSPVLDDRTRSRR